MPTDNRTPDEIERDIEHERAELASTVDALQDKFTPEAVIRQITQGFRDHGGEFGTAVSRSVKQNPLALAITGVGLAWLMFGRSYDPLASRPGGSHRARFSSHRDNDDDTTAYRSYGNGYAAGSYDNGADYRSERASTSTYRSAGTSRYAQQGYGSQRAQYPDWAQHDLDDDHDSGPSMGDRLSGAASSVGNTASRAGSGAANAANSAASGVKSAAGSVGAGASSAAASVSAGARSVGAGVRNAAHTTAERAAMARERLARGTEELSEAARERVIEARARAIEVARRAEATARRNYARGRDAAADFIEEQPLVAGALAMAIGAALAGALPRTRTEDEYLGETRDQLFDEAERIFQEERQKVERVGKAAMDEAGKIAQEKREEADNSAPGNKNAVEAAADEVRKSGERVADAARKKAESENLGKPKT